MVMVAAIKNFFPRIKIDIERWRFNEEAQLYVSNQGRVKRKNGQLIDFKIRRDNGYITVCTKDSGFWSVHQLVAKTWIPCDDPEKNTVDHLDHNKRNNRVENLEWVSLKENRSRAKRDEIYDPETAERLIQKHAEKIKSLKKENAELRSKNDRLTNELKGLEPMEVVSMDIADPCKTPYVYVNGNPLCKRDFDLMLVGSAQGNTKALAAMQAKVKLFLASNRPRLVIGGMELRRLNSI